MKGIWRRQEEMVEAWGYLLKSIQIHSQQSPGSPASILSFFLLCTWVHCLWNNTPVKTTVMEMGKRVMEICGKYCNPDAHRCLLSFYHLVSGQCSDVGCEVSHTTRTLLSSTDLREVVLRYCTKNENRIKRNGLVFNDPSDGCYMVNDA